MKLTRRNLLRTGAAAVGGASAAGALGVPSPASAAGAAAAPVGPATLAATLARGAAGAGGYRPLVAAPGEAHLVRTDLGAQAGAGRSAARTPVIAFAQLSDVHIVDAQSPLRLEFTDRLDDPSPLPPTLFSSAYRAHEMLSGQIADAMVRQINGIGTGPVTGAPLALAIQTGDNSDNSQFNEINWNIGILNGGAVRVDSGSLLKFEGVADGTSAYYDPGYWHPHGTPANKVDDIYRKQYGFPVVPGLLDAARRPFEAEGLNMPWYSAFGNHDGLVQGNFPQLLQLSLVSTGALKLNSLPASLSPAELLNSLQSGDLARLLQSLALTPAVRAVSPDVNRRLLTRKQVVEQHFAAGGAPFGHGFTAENRSKGTAHYFFDQGDCRFIVMDTVNPNGYSDGSIDNAQFAWLEQVLNQSVGKIVMVFSHHTSWTMKNTLIGTGGVVETRVNGARRAGAVAEPQGGRGLDQRPHSQEHSARPHPPRGRRALGDQHRLPHRLAAAVATDRDRRQPGRHPVDLCDDGRPRRPSGVRRQHVRHRAPGLPRPRAGGQRPAEPHRLRPRSAGRPQRRAAGGEAELIGSTQRGTR